MGLEANCAVTWNGRRAVGKAHCETTELTFRGEFRLRIPFRDISAVNAENGELIVTFPEGTARFELGPQAERWAKRVTNPPSRLDKLGVKAGQSIAVIDVPDESFRRDLVERVGDIVDAPEPPIDIVFLGIDRLDDLAPLTELRESLSPNGAIWVISPKGRRDLRDVDIFAAAKAVGLVDVKVAAFSATHTASKFVIPRALRR
ncbi:MAG: DUF3052 family protein [Chloroflexota bacterium]|nr:MAG: DUF3052 family protein [Chloroflexota bacterium]